MLFDADLATATWLQRLEVHSLPVDLLVEVQLLLSLKPSFPLLLICKDRHSVLHFGHNIMLHLLLFLLHLALMLVNMTQKAALEHIQFFEVFRHCAYGLTEPIRFFNLPREMIIEFVDLGIVCPRRFGDTHRLPNVLEMALPITVFRVTF